MYLVFSLLKKDCKVIGVKWPIIKSSCTGGSIYHFHENLTLPADEEIAINKIRSHLQKEIQHSFSSVWIALKQTNKKKYEKMIQKIQNYFMKWALHVNAFLWFCFQTPLIEGKSLKWKRKVQIRKRDFSRYIPVWKTYLHKTLCIIK